MNTINHEVNSLQSNCLNKADFKKKMDESRNKKNEGEQRQFSDDFKVALAAITSGEDYKALEEQFFGKAGK